MKKFMTFIKSSRLPFLSGVLFGTSYTPFPPWAILFAYVPLMLFLAKDAKSPWEAFRGGWVVQFVLSLIGFHWIAHTAHEFGDFPWFLAVIVLLLFATFVHLHIPLAALAAYELKSRFKLPTTATYFLFAISLSMTERIWPMIFPWHAGYTLLWAESPIAQWADVIGFWGLSALILLANAWLTWIWTQRSHRGKALTHLAALAAIIALLWVGGQSRKEPWMKMDETLRILATQANIGNADKVYAEHGRGYQNAITRKFVTLTQEGYQNFPDADLAVWPETSFPDYLDHPEQSYQRLEILKEGLGPYGKPLLTGAYAKDFKSPPQGGPPLSYNALFLVNPDGQVLSGPYRKTVLLAFGEYFPFSEQFPQVLQWLPFISNFGRGHGPQVLNLPRPDGSNVRLGGQICYEGLFPDFSRGLSTEGAQIMVNVTNDSWFGTSFEPKQHMIMTLARALEVRLPLLRVTNTGITSAIQASGEMLERSPSEKQWVGEFALGFQKNPEVTFYTRYGHYDWVLLLIAMCGIVAAGWGHARTQRP